MKRGIVAMLGLALVIATAAFGLFAGGSASANHAADPDEITISTVGSPVAAVGGNVTVALAVTTSTAPHKAIQWELAYGFNLTHVSSVYNCTNPGGINYPNESDTAPVESVLIPATVKNLGGGSNCASLNAGFMGAAMTGTFVTVTLSCDAAGQTFISMRPAGELANPANDPNFGTTLIDAGSLNIPTTLENQAPIPGFGSQAAVGVACVTAVDLSISKAGPAAAAEGDAGVYTLTVNNPTAVNQTANISDAMPAGVTATAASAGCTTGATVTCNGYTLVPGANIITINVTFDTCGNKSNSATVTLVDPAPPSVVDPNPANNTSNTVVTNVDCANLTITKFANINGAGPNNAPNQVGVQGQSVVYTYNVCNDAGGTTANGVTVTDVPNGPVGPAQNILSGTCTTFTSASILLASLGLLCNTATADGTNTNPSATSNQICINVVPSLTGIAKDLDPNTDGPQATGNLWICKGTNFPDDFAGPDSDLPASQANCNQLSIAELVSFTADIDTCNDNDDGENDGSCAGVNSASEQLCGNGIDDDADGTVDDGCGINPPVGPTVCQIAAENFIPGQSVVDCEGDEVAEGLGAWELQVKYDHKLFAQPVLNCGAYLGSTGRAVQPQVSVITENWSLFGCVTKDPTPGAPDGNPNGPNPPAGTVGTLVVTIQPDLFQRIRPTKDNGVVTDLLDENCEIADIYGMPFAGSVQGGLTPDCGDATITIRMLEGDVDLDCNVTLLDDQAMAYRYGSFFGNLLYNRFFDLEPNIAPDFDIDIKDLQTVFGRNGSTCDAPIPDQGPQDQTPDP